MGIKKKGMNVVNKSPPKCDLVYSRGGTGSNEGMDTDKMLVCLEEKAQFMQTIAISYASSQGINLRPGVSTYGRGDCIFKHVLISLLDQSLKTSLKMSLNHAIG